MLLLCFLLFLLFWFLSDTSGRLILYLTIFRRTLLCYVAIPVVVLFVELAVKNPNINGIIGYHILSQKQSVRVLVAKFCEDTVRSCNIQYNMIYYLQSTVPLETLEAPCRR